jgi:hypothetical protein
MGLWSREGLETEHQTIAAMLNSASTNLSFLVRAFMIAGAVRCGAFSGLELQRSRSAIQNQFRLLWYDRPIERAVGS